jgi:hypothetical protein
VIGRIPLSGVGLAWRGLLVLATGIAVAVELAFPWEQPSGIAPPAFTGQAELSYPAGAAPGTYAAIAEHPLFHPSRAPWVAPPAPPPAVARATLQPPADYVLAGVVLSGGARSAIVKPGNAAKAVVVSEGETLNGWMLRRIDAAGLHFEAGGQTFDLGFPGPRPGGH